MTFPRSAAGRPVSAYAAVGAEIINFTVDVESGELTRRASVGLPSRVRYVWPHATLPLLYAACGSGALVVDGKPGIPGAQGHYLCALLRDEVGDLSLHGEPVALPSRPIQLTTDIPGDHVLVAYSRAPGLSMHRILADGTIGEEIPRAEPFDAGSATHQVRVTPANDRAILVARGMKGFGDPSYVEGALKVLRFDDGRIENLHSVAPADPAALGGFNPRNLDFHPTKPLMFLTLEGQHKLCVFRMNGAELDPTLLFAKDMLAWPNDIQPRQDAGAVHTHPNGKYVYAANRNDGYVGGHAVASWLTPDPIPIFPGGENSIAVFEIDEDTGEPTLIQLADSHGLHPRTFGLDPAGRLLIAGNLAPTVLQDGDTLTDVPANLAVFRIGEDGKLKFLRRYPIDVGAEKIWWMGVVA